ncbi:hypothetical protein ABW19_dt0200445 [Dactylella cylindrospora]|nr:hypothetical protein ABW19_dt0200445 [Dactylella cylindrospora]
MSGYQRSNQSPPRHPSDYDNGGQQAYANPAFAPQNQGMNYDTPYNTGAPEYGSQVYGRTPLRHQASYGQGQTPAQGFEQPQSRSLPGASQEGWDNGYATRQHESSPPRGDGYPQQQQDVSPTRSRGIPVDDHVSYSYGHQQQQQQQSRALLPQNNWDNNSYGYQEQPPQPPQPPQQVPMRQINQYASHETLQHGRAGVPPPGYAGSSQSSHRSPSAPPAATLDRQGGVGSRNSGTASSVNLGFYSDSPYQRYSTHWNPETTGLSSGDLTLQDMRRNSQDSDDEETSRGKRGGALAGGMGLGGVFGRKNEASSTVSGLGANSGLLTAGAVTRGAQDSSWLQDQKKASKKSKWIIAAVVIVILLLAGGGAAAGVLLTRKNNGSSGSSSSVNPEEDAVDAPPVTGNTDSVKALLNNPNLHKSFYGMDYTPLNAIYPECLKWPPTQNNITKDIAVISQLTTRLRLYGNDCNQTEMVLEAIKLLDVDLKVWMGIYIDNNQTTNDRQLSQMYSILDTYGQDPFIGVVLGNEALFRKEITELGLSTLVSNVRQNFTNLGYTSINITTSDLGSAWTYTLADSVDVSSLMSLFPLSKSFPYIFASGRTCAGQSPCQRLKGC